MKRFFKVLSLCVAISVLTLNTFAEANSSSDKIELSPEETIEQLQKELEELQTLVDKLTEENESLKKQLGESEQESESEEIDVPENVANADANTEYTEKSIVLLVQQTLNSLGYNCGAADGVAGSNTKAQITKYQEDNGLTENGIITDQLLESLGIADKVAEEAKKEAEKAKYSGDYSYEQLARNPDSYKGETMKFTGKVLQAQTEDTLSYMRLAINSDYNKVIFVSYDKELIDYRILEDDIVTIYGTCFGEFSYQSVMAGTITIPWIVADIIELQ